MSDNVIGIDLGGTNMQIGVVDDAGEVRAHIKRKTRADNGLESVLERVREGIREACEGASIQPSDLGAIGIGVPGAVDPQKGLVHEAVNLRWNDVQLASLLGKHFDVPIVVDNDVNVAVYGEWKAGAGKGATDIMGVWLGTGVGGGLILNNALYYGHFRSAGEIGHMVLFPNNPPGGRSVEQACSRTAIVDRLVRLIRANEASVIPDLVDGKLGKVKSKTLAEAYRTGDALTVEVITWAAEALGVTIGSIVTLLSLQRIVLGGGLIEELGEELVPVVRKSIHKYVFPDELREVEVVATALGDHAGLLGAAFLAQEARGAAREAAPARLQT